MQNIIFDVDNNSQKILPVPFQKSPVSSVANPNNYGNSPYPMHIKSSLKKDDDSQYCNFLEPSPRDQRLNVPYEGNKNCPNFKTYPYDKDSCYLMNSTAQGVVGIVCNQSGKSDNANFYRGNQFGMDYPVNYDKLKKMEYTVEQPIQIPLQLENPMIMYDKNTFYPDQSHFIKKNKDYKTYPLEQNYTEWGLPTYTYPYKTMNPIFKDPNQIDSIEDFNNNYNKSNILLLIILLIVFLLFIFYVKCI